MRILFIFISLLCYKTGYCMHNEQPEWNKKLSEAKNLIEMAELISVNRWSIVYQDFLNGHKYVVIAHKPEELSQIKIYNSQAKELLNFVLNNKETPETAKNEISVILQKMNY